MIEALSHYISASQPLLLGVNGVTVLLPLDATFLMFEVHFWGSAGNANMDMSRELAAVRDIAEDRLVQLTASQTENAQLQLAGCFDASHCSTPQVRLFVAVELHFADPLPHFADPLAYEGAIRSASRVSTSQRLQIRLDPSLYTQSVLGRVVFDLWLSHRPLGFVQPNLVTSPK